MARLTLQVEGIKTINELAYAVELTQALMPGDSTVDTLISSMSGAKFSAMCELSEASDIVEGDPDGG